MVAPDVRVPATRHREFMRRRVIQEATFEAERRPVLARLGSVLAPADGLGFDPCATRTDRTALHRRRARGRRVTIATTVLLATVVLAALLLS